MALLRFLESVSEIGREQKRPLALMKLIYLKSALKFDSFHVAIGIKIPFFKSFGYY